MVRQAWSILSCSKSVKTSAQNCHRPNTNSHMMIYKRFWVNQVRIWRHKYCAVRKRFGWFLACMTRSMQHHNTRQAHDEKKNDEMQNVNTREGLLPGTVSTTCAGSFSIEWRFYHYIVSKRSLQTLQPTQTHNYVQHQIRLGTVIMRTWVLKTPAVMILSPLQACPLMHCSVKWSFKMNQNDMLVQWWNIGGTWSD